MKKLSALLLLFALACTSTSTTPAPAPTPRRQLADTVNVTIESRPDSAEVYIGGKFIGTTPMVARLAPGDHRIEVRHPNRGPWERELTVLAGSPTRVMALLAEK